MIYYYLPNKKLIWTLKKQWRINSIKEELRLKVDEFAKKHSEAIAKKKTREVTADSPRPWKVYRLRTIVQQTGSKVDDFNT